MALYVRIFVMSLKQKSHQTIKKSHSLIIANDDDDDDDDGDGESVVNNIL